MSRALGRRRAACATALAGLVALGGAGPTARAASTFIPRDTYDHPGRLVELPDHRRLNFLCLGEGSPTVILESGFGAGAFAWGRVQARIATVTRVCAYDRAGYGFSDPGPMPRDGEAIARDLDHGLRAARLSGPYVLVGHSAGGLYARLFAARRRREIAGLVLVDSSVEHQVPRGWVQAGKSGLESVRRRSAHCLEVLQAADSVAIEAERKLCANGAGPGPSGLGLRPEVWQTQVSELETLFDATSDEVDRTGGLLRDIPVIVLTAAKTDGPSDAPADPADLAWQGLHQRLAESFRHGEQRLVKSGHLMMNERPEVVAGAAIEMVEAARKR